MAKVLITGMSGTGKSSAITELARRGHRVVDTDYDGYSREGPCSAGGLEQLWNEERMAELLDEEGPLFVSGCVSNQGQFYSRFDAVVLLSAPLDVILERVASRDTNPFGKAAAERERIVSDLAMFEPLLRVGATVEIDTRKPLASVADELEALAAQVDSVMSGRRDSGR